MGYHATDITIFPRADDDCATSSAYYDLHQQEAPPILVLFYHLVMRHWNVVESLQSCFGRKICPRGFTGKILLDSQTIVQGVDSEIFTSTVSCALLVC